MRLGTAILAHNIFGSYHPDQATLVALDVLVGTATGQFSAERVLTPGSDMGQAPWIINKNATEVVNNSAVMQNDDELKFSVAVGTYHRFRFSLHFDGAVGNNIEFGLYGPAGSTAYWSCLSENATGTVSFDSTKQIGDTAAIIGEGVGVIKHVVIEGIFINPTTAGDFGLRWCQNPANLTNTSLYILSSLEAERVI